MSATLRTIHSAHSGTTGKVVSARDAVKLIRPGDTVAVGGFGGIGIAEEVVHELGAFYQAADEEPSAFGGPRDLTIYFTAGPGNPFTGRGLNRLGLPGLVKRSIGGHYNYVPGLGQLITANQIEGYNLPLGPMSHLYRDIAAGRPGHLSRIGLGTFADPRFGGGKLNERTTEDLVDLMTVGGQEYLFYKALPINVGIIRGTTADLDGNITMEREALTLEALSLAMAAHNSSGLVIAQVERIAEPGTLNPRDVKIPGALVDCLVVAEPENHTQTYATTYSPAFSSELRVPMTSLTPLELDARKVLARRAAMELRSNSVVNLGIGVPEGIARVAAEEKVSELMTLTTEAGVIGGIAAGGLDFGAATNAQAVLDLGYQFDFYDGGGLDVAFLGLAQADKEGNLNVSRFGPRLAGAGGFIDISQTAKKVVFLGTFTAGEHEISIAGGHLRIHRDGKHHKFVREVEQRTFSGPYAAEEGREVLYITERCVFRLTSGGLELIEVAPGVDIQRDIVDKMDFEPIIDAPREMDPRIFADAPMGLRADMLRLPLEARVNYHADQNILYLNFEDLEVTSPEVIRDVVQEIRTSCDLLGHRVDAVVNYDGFSVSRELEDAYVAAVREASDLYFREVTRFTTSAFMRAKLGDTLESRGVAPHVFESEEEAAAALLPTRSLS